MSLRVKELALYPVKSLAACYPAEALIEETGLRHDRAWMIVNSDGFFLTQREHPRMARVSATPLPDALRLEIPEIGTLDVPILEEGVERRVQVWDDRCSAIDQGEEAAQFLTAFLRRPCRLVRMKPGFRRELREKYRNGSDVRVGFADSTPFLLISAASLDDLNSRLDKPVAMSRFRPNIVVAGGDPFQEDRWSRIRIGESCFRVVSDCIRCEIITVDQSTGEKGVEPMETLGSYRQGPRGIRFGRKVVHAGPGRIRVGDSVKVLE